MMDQGDFLDTLGNTHPCAIYLPALQEAIGALSTDSDPHARFLDLCNIADLAYPPGAPSVHELRANPLTPYLAAYALAALRNYRVRYLARMEALAGAKQGRKKGLPARERDALLRAAFGAVGEQGGSRGAPEWGTEAKMAALAEFTATTELANAPTGSNSPREKERRHRAVLNGYDAAYRLAFGSDTYKSKDGEEKSRDSREVRKYRKQLTDLLTDHGYGGMLGDALKFQRRQGVSSAT